MRGVWEERFLDLDELDGEEEEEREREREEIWEGIERRAKGENCVVLVALEERERREERDKLMEAEGRRCTLVSASGFWLLSC